MTCIFAEFQIFMYLKFLYHEWGILQKIQWFQESRINDFVS